jgi:hypothetical protein
MYNSKAVPGYTQGCNEVPKTKTPDLSSRGAEMNADNKTKTDAAALDSFMMPSFLSSPTLSSVSW